MKTNTRTISVIALILIGAFAGCEKDNIDSNRIEDGKGKEIAFSVSEQTTRTVYGDKEGDKWPIYWTDKDSIRIFCNEVEDDVKNAEYGVIPVTLENSNQGKLKANDKGLRWGSDDGVHNFYAVYPNNLKKASVKDGIGIFSLNYNQVCTVKGGPVNSNYIAEPDMSNAYMVANLSTTPVDDVVLNFRPIMTTLNITVRGREQNNTGTITLTGISIVNNSVNYSRTEDGCFNYDIVNNKVLTSETNKKGTIFVRVKHNKDYHLDLEPGQSVTFTVFLPPIPINDANKIDIRVHATGETTYTTTIGGNTDSSDKTIEFATSSKGSLTLGWYPTTQNGNNWITPLDDDIYVSQLSIPGTHDAATKDAGYVITAGRCQDLTIEEQLQMGIRAFDLRPTTTGTRFSNATSDGNRNLPIYHGVTSCKTDMEKVFNIFNSYLDKNPGEFIIVICRWENEGAYGYPISTSFSMDMFNTCMTNFLNKVTYYPTNRKTAFEADLTVGKARNKIIIIMRPNQGTSPDGYYANTALEGTTFITGWPAGGNDVRRGVYFKSEYEGNATGYAIVQDYFNPKSTTEKISLVKEELDLSAQSHTNSEYTNTWFINHCSGYIGNAASYEAYSNNAAVTNPAIYEYLTGDKKQVGSTGIMMLDFVGKRTAAVSGIEVYGDLLPQAIIDNNYKYHMKRKGE